MAYAITGTSVFPAVMVMAASYDGSHGVQISYSDKGTVVTLKHRRDAFTPGVEDHGNSLARALVSFCSDANSGDHQLSCAQFQFNAETERETVSRIAQIEPYAEVTAACPFYPEAFEAVSKGLAIKTRQAFSRCLTDILATVRLVI